MTGADRASGAATVSVVIPARNEAGYIRRCLEAVFANDYPADLVEVIVADGRSDDGTRDVVARTLAAHPGRRVTVIDNPARTTPHALNLAIGASSGRFIVRVDGHSEISPDYIRRCVELLQTVPGAGCVGGVFENVAGTPMGRVIAMALASPFGVGNALYRLDGHEGPVDTVPFGAFPREVFATVGLFDEDLVRNQDDEYTFRLRRAGYVVWLSPAIRVRYHTRASLGRMARQFAQYGFWKVYVNRKHRVVTTVRQLVPPLFVAALAAAAVAAATTAWGGTALVALLAAYALAALAAAVAKSRRPVEVAALIASFFVLHLSYGAGYLRGLGRFVLLNRPPAASHAALTR